MAHTIREKKKLLSRVRRIKGQAEALEKALDEEVYCMVVLHQIASIRGAVNGLMMEVLEEHIREHLGEDTEPAKQRQQDLEEMISVLRSYLK